MNLPAFTNEDRLPHDRAVWRQSQMPSRAEIDAGVAVSIDRGSWTEQTTADRVDWADVWRWRFGWAPR